MTTQHSDVSAAVVQLNDERLIRRSLALYCQLLDDRRFDDWIKLFAEDAEWTIPSVTFKGRREIEAGLRKIDAGPLGICKHLTFHSVIEFDAPSEARAWSDLVCIIRDPRPENRASDWRVVSAGRYYDRLAKGGDGLWYFTKRIADIDEAHDPIGGLDPVPIP